MGSCASRCPFNRGRVRLGLAQSAEQGAHKFVDCLLGRVGGHGALIGAPEGKALGDLVDQTPLNDAFSDVALRKELWDVLIEVLGPYAGAGESRKAAGRRASLGADAPDVGLACAP